MGYVTLVVCVDRASLPLLVCFDLRHMVRLRLVDVYRRYRFPLRFGFVLPLRDCSELFLSELSNQHISSRLLVRLRGKIQFLSHES